MRMKRSRMKQYSLRPAETKKDKEQATYTEYGEPVSFCGEVWPAGGKLQAELYGNRLSYIRNVKIGGDYVITTDRTGKEHYVYPSGLEVVENDGLCLYVDSDANPDYKIISIKPFVPLRLEAEKL